MNINYKWLKIKFSRIDVDLRSLFLDLKAAYDVLFDSSEEKPYQFQNLCRLQKLNTFIRGRACTMHMTNEKCRKTFGQKT
jgi:hypothetical protein